MPYATKTAPAPRPDLFGRKFSFNLLRAGDLKDVTNCFIKVGDSVQTIWSMRRWSCGYRRGIYIMTDKTTHSFDLEDYVLISY